MVEHVYSSALDHALTRLARVLGNHDLPGTADKVDQAGGQLREAARRIVPKPSDEPQMQAHEG